MMSDEKSPALAILIGKGKSPMAGKGGKSGGMMGMDDSGDYDSESSEGDTSHAETRKNLKAASGWDDDVIDALHEYIEDCINNHEAPES